MRRDPEVVRKTKSRSGRQTSSPLNRPARDTTAAAAATVTINCT